MDAGRQGCDGLLGMDGVGRRDENGVERFLLKHRTVVGIEGYVGGLGPAFFQFGLEGKIRSLTAMGRLQGWVVGAMPLALLVVLSLLDPVMIRQFVTSLPGVIILGLVVLLELAGAWFIRRIIRIEI